MCSYATLKELFRFFSKSFTTVTNCPSALAQDFLLLWWNVNYLPKSSTGKQMILPPLCIQFRSAWTDFERIKAIEIFSFDNISANRKKRPPNNAKGTEYKTHKNHENQRKKLRSNHSLIVFVRRKKGKITTAIRMMEKNQQLLNEVYIQKTW